MTGCSLGLIALAVGYFVLVQANKEKGRMKSLGQLIGVLIMVSAALSGFYVAKYKMGGACPFTGKALMCPFTGKSMMGAPAQTLDGNKN